MRLRDSFPLALLAALVAPTVAQQEEGRAYFSLSSNRTYGPGEKPAISLWADGVDKLQFRVYRINNPEAFFEQLEDPHRFGGQAPAPPRAPTPLETFNQWKRRVRYSLRDFIRAQYSPSARGEIRDWLARRSQKAVSPKTPTTQYAEIPLLNPQQVVAVWEQSAQGRDRWSSQNIPINVDKKGLYLVEATNGKLVAQTVISVTNLAIVAKAAPGRLFARVVERTRGSPVPDIPVILRVTQKEAARLPTDRSGLVQFTINETRPDQVLLMARRGEDFAVASPYAWSLSNADDWLMGYVYTDRPVYRPGHDVHFRAVLRAIGETAYKLPAAKEVRVEVQGPDGKEVFRGTAPVSSFGTVNGQFVLSGAANLGYYSVQLVAGEAHMYGGFHVEEYRKPEFAVTVRPVQRRYLQGAVMEAEVEARYYYGEPVTEARLTYAVHRSRYWSYGEFDEDMEMENYGGGEEQVLQETGALDENGRTTIRIPSEPGEADLLYRIEARVTDASNREITGTGWIAATVGPHRIQVLPTKYVFEPGEQARFEITTRDYDGNPVPDVAFRFDLADYHWGNTEGRVHTTVEGRTDAAGTAFADVRIPDRSALMARVSYQTAEGRRVEGSCYVWVESDQVWSSGQQRLQIIPDKKSYKAGEVAHVLLVTGMPDAELWVSTEGRTLRQSQFISAKGPSVTVDVPVLADYAPNFYLSALFIRDHQLYMGSKSISVPPVEHELEVKVTSSKEVFKPGETGVFTIHATDSGGQPVAAEFSLGVVDEAIYAVRNEPGQEILPFFYGRTHNRVGFDSSLSFHFSGEAGKRRMRLAGTRRKNAFAQLKPERFVMPKVRKAFPDTIFWMADLKTDAAGQALAKVTFPDALTAWRATARGITRDTKAGSARNQTRVRKNLILRLAVPRFFTEGDEVTISAIVHNYLETKKNVRISLEAQGVEILEGKTADVVVDSRKEAKVDYRVRVIPGREAILVGKALTDEESDALELRLPVTPYGVKLADAKAGALSGSEESTGFELTYPAEVVPHSKEVEISITPSVAGAILGALEYLTSYPYGCTEQTMSSFLPNVLVSQTMKSLKLKTDIDEGELARKVNAGLERLAGLQHEEGGWGWWRSDDSDPFMTAYVITGLKHAKDAGYGVNERQLQRGVEWLKGEFARLAAGQAEVSAYVLHALALNGAADRAAFNAVWDRRGALSPYGQALLGLALEQAGDSRADGIAGVLEASATREPGGVFWEAGEDRFLGLHSTTSPEATAHVIKLLMKKRPQSPLLEQAAMWLVKNRDRGSYWASTKQTALVIYGLIDYLRAGGELKPDFVVSVTLNDREVLSRRFGPADALSAEPVSVRLDSTQLQDGVNRIRVTKKGTGRLYWSTRSDYHTRQDAISRTGKRSLLLNREYFKLTPVTEGGKIVHRLDPFDGTVSSGDVLAVRLTLEGSEWQYLLIEDPIPSGTEFITRADLYELADRPPWWSFWFDRREYHDNRAAFYIRFFDEREAQYVYLLKVINPGHFRVSPARVSPMYQPEYITTSKSRTVEVR